MTFYRNQCLTHLDILKGWPFKIQFMGLVYFFMLYDNQLTLLKHVWDV